MASTRQLRSHTAAKAAARLPQFPPDIWWLVAQELAARLDFSSLFACARASTTLANLSLPLLYGVHEQSPASSAHIQGIEASVCLWRSIIASSLGKTLYPYCRWLRVLELGNLLSLLEDLARDDTGLRDHFFSPPLRKFQIRRGRGPALNLDAIVVDVADHITECVRAAADQDNRLVSLSRLEGPYLPSNHLSKWVSKLSQLQSLTVRDGSVLNGDVAHALRESCPLFREVVCFFCKGTDVDASLAGFFRGLAPNTLESFTVNSMNDLGGETFQALSGHSASLRRLGLFSLERPAFDAMDRLSPCTSLESLTLEASWNARYRPDWAAAQPEVFGAVIDWLSACASLRELEFLLVPCSTAILSQVLREPSIQLSTLSLKPFEIDDGFYAALSCQRSLRHLTVRIANEELFEVGSDERSAAFAAAIVECPELRELDTNEMLSLDDFSVMAACLPMLEEIIFNGELIDDRFLEPLARFSRLRSLNIFGASLFTFDGLSKFLWTLARDEKGMHEGIQLYVANQGPESVISEAEKTTLSDYTKEYFGGRFDIAGRLPEADAENEWDSSD